METILAEYKQGFWYINGKPKVFCTMSYQMPTNAKGRYYILVRNNTIIDAVKCQNKR